MAEVSEDWHRCYGQGWGDLLAPEAYSHPAKVSRALARRIYDHLIDEGWLELGMVVLDPFAGIGGFALHAMKHGLNWVGVELEEKFVDLGQQNIDLWNSRFSQLPGWGSAVILQGDSRRLTEVVGEARACISSPPYAKSDLKFGRPDNVIQRAVQEYESGLESGKQMGCGKDNSKIRQKDGYGTDPANLGNMPEGKLADAVVSSPPYVKYGTGHDGACVRLDDTEDTRRESEGCARRPAYGDADGQLANMPEGEFDGVVASPPYVDNAGKGGETKGFHSYDKDEAYNRCKRDYIIPDTNGQLAALPEGEFEAVVSSPPYVDSVGSRDKGSGIDWEKAGRPDRLEPSENRHNVQGNTPMAYGNTDGQLADLPEGEFEACVSSPPWESVGNFDESVRKFDETAATITSRKNAGIIEKSYGDSLGQLGQETGNTFWSAAKVIVQQVYQLLAPGSPAVWVVKAFVRKGKRVDFPGQWQQLCESVGFETVHIHRAWLVEDRGSQYDLFGKVQENKVERKSFFRRLHEFHASAKMYWEQHVTDRNTRAKYMWNAHRELWESYHIELAENKKQHQLPPTPPTRSKIMTSARVSVYKDGGEPWMDIPTRIDFEVVLCQRKP